MIMINVVNNIPNNFLKFTCDIILFYLSFS
jgi:hypothetical protein